jgi:hypothetical protein
MGYRLDDPTIRYLPWGASVVVLATIVWDLLAMASTATPQSAGLLKSGTTRVSAMATEDKTVSSPALERRTLDIEIKGRKVAGKTVVRVKQGEQVFLRWTTDESVTVHLHGYDMEKKLKPGESVILDVRAHATGRFPIEAHEFGGKKTKHITLLYLEVLPR